MLLLAQTCFLQRPGLIGGSRLFAAIVVLFDWLSGRIQFHQASADVFLLRLALFDVDSDQVDQTVAYLGLFGAISLLETPPLEFRRILIAKLLLCGFEGVVGKETDCGLQFGHERRTSRARLRAAIQIRLADEAFLGKLEPLLARVQD